MTRLFVPGATRDEQEPKFVCRVPVNDDGELCGRLFYEDENRAFQLHATKCAAANRSHIEALSKARTLDGLLSPWDPEVDEHMRKVGRQMRKEGRWTVNPNERAGF
jgi:hypothetical protein